MLKPIMTESMLFSTNLLANRFVLAGLYATAGGKSFGVLNSDVDVDFSEGGNSLVITDGIAEVEAGEAISEGQHIQVGADGVAMVLVDGVDVGVARDSVDGAGELVSIKLIPVQIDVPVIGQPEAFIGWSTGTGNACR